jgi:hypothetical protein
MTRRLAILFLGACIAAQALAQEAAEPKTAAAQRVRFLAVDVYLDSGKTTLAAYQFELVVESGSVKIVGVEGGEHAAFKDAPYYDPAALKMDKVIIAAFSTGKDLPTGKTRIARVHVQVTGNVEPKYAAALHVAADSEGRKISASVSLVQGEQK